MRSTLIGIYQSRDPLLAGFPLSIMGNWINFVCDLLALVMSIRYGLHWILTVLYPPHCRVEMYAGHVACCTLVSHRWIWGRDRQTDGRTDRYITVSAMKVSSITTDTWHCSFYTAIMTKIKLYGTSPDADGFDAKLSSINFAFCRPDNQLINVLMIKLLLAVRVEPRVALIAAYSQTWQQK